MNTTILRRLARTTALLAALSVAACSGSGSGTGTANGASSAVLVSGTNGGQYYSFDGVTWSPVLGMVGAYDASGVAYGDGVFVWVGNCGVGCSGSAESSNDLADPFFNRAELGSFSDVRDVVFGDGLFVAVGSQPSFGALAWASTDGANWAPSPIAGFDDASDIAFGNGLFVAAASSTGGPNDAVVRSPDGANWIGVQPPDAAVVSSVSFGDGEFIAIGARASDMANCAWFSTDAATWSGPFDMGTSGAGFFVEAAAFGDGAWVVVGSGGSLGRVWRSANGGATWSDLLLGGPVLRDVAFDGEAFFAVGGTGTILSSTDGITWFDVGPVEGALFTGVTVVR